MEDITDGLSGPNSQEVLVEGCNAFDARYRILFYYTEVTEGESRPLLNVVHKGKLSPLTMSTISPGILVFEDGINTRMLEEHPELCLDSASDEALQAFMVEREDSRPITVGSYGLLNDPYEKQTGFEMPTSILDSQEVDDLLQQMQQWYQACKHSMSLPPHISGAELIFLEGHTRPVQLLAEIFEILRGVHFNIENNNKNVPTANMILRGLFSDIVEELATRVSRVLQCDNLLVSYLTDSTESDVSLVLSDREQTSPHASFSMMNDARLVRRP